MKWEVIKKYRKYRAGDKDCMLCNEEKLAVASCNGRDMLNQRSEVLNTKGIGSSIIRARFYVFVQDVVVCFFVLFFFPLIN